MKPVYFVGIIALVLGITSVACSSHSNEPSAFSEQEVEATPSVGLTDWDNFNKSLDSLNAQYKALRPNGVKYQVSSSIPTYQLATADAKGAVKWLEIIKTLSNGQVMVKPTTVVMSVLHSFEEYREYTDIDTTSAPITPVYNSRPIPTLEYINSYAEVGEEHNQVLRNLLEMQDAFNMRRDELILTIIDLYEEQYSIIPTSSKAKLRNLLEDMRSARIKREVLDVTEDFTETIATMNIVTKRSYTDDFVELVDSTITDTHDRRQLKTYASVMYYSSSFWVAE